MAAVHQGQATSASYGLWLGRAHLALGCQQAAANSSWAVCEARVTQLCNSLPLFSSINAAVHWAPLLLPWEPRSSAEGYQEKADRCLVDSPCLLNANRRQITGRQKTHNLTLASDFPVRLSTKEEKNNNSVC